MNQFPKCPFCDNYHFGRCPEVRSVEYYENGAIKKVEYENGQNISAECFSVELYAPNKIIDTISDKKKWG